MLLLDRITASRIRDGDVQAFENLINNFKIKVFNYCFRVIGNYHKAEELTQEIFIKVYTNINTYDSNKASLSTWIYTISHNECLNFIRNCKSEIPLDDISEDSICSSIEESIIINENIRRLNSIMSSFSERDRSMILMKDYLGLKNSEISRIFDIPEGTVKSRLNFLRTKIRTLAGDAYD